MAYEQRDNGGSLFDNDRKERDTHPDRRGKALIGGVWYWVSAWDKYPDGKAAFLSLSFEPMTEEHIAKYANPAQQQYKPQQPKRQEPHNPPAAPSQRAASGPSDEVHTEDDLPF